MLLRDMLITEYKDVIDTILRASTRNKNNESRDLIASTIVRSMKTSGIKEPSKSPFYILALALREYQKSGTWPSKFSEFVDELKGLTGLSPSTIRSSLASQPWDVPLYLRPSLRGKREPYLSEKVNILKDKPAELSHPAQQELFAKSNIRPDIDVLIKPSEIEHQF